jgi:Na+-transporting NADH:ubiquinone oxidoreductase subunit A
LGNHQLKRGLNLPLAGEPAQAIDESSPCTRGQSLFEDRVLPGVRHTAPAAGLVRALNRGDRRAFLSLVIDIEGDQDPEAQVAFSSFRGATPEALTPEDVRALLLESGLWTALRTRPFSKVPSPETKPHALYITAIDTRPHAPAVPTALAGREEDFSVGVACLSRLTEGATYVCVAPGHTLPRADAASVRTEVFAARIRRAMPARTSIC